MAALHRDLAERETKDNVIAMSAVHAWTGWVFVDYCHFSKEANRRSRQARATQSAARARAGPSSPDEATED